MIEREGESQIFEGGREIVEDIGRFVLLTIEPWGLTQKVKNNIELAVGEAIDNIFEHGYGEKNGKIEISLQNKDNTLIVKIYDSGKTFDSDKISQYKPEAVLNDSQSRGLGIYIIRKVMDEVKYDSDPIKGNTLTLIKKL